ncbi:hypothetical protein RchiOBHm_Chr7g0219591 [Rosa chinensis]|uniref:Uncharacterized protein n=1 Tax=Rosa chinensis TaxID=74649 RepID=A0A2P6PCJ6_ROSCH|nr:hypothetical protein RchiOBHm_Chr7g0219591 [Rosa chinensis]
MRLETWMIFLQALFHESKEKSTNQRATYRAIARRRNSYAWSAK